MSSSALSLLKDCLKIPLETQMWSSLGRLFFYPSGKGYSVYEIDFLISLLLLLFILFILLFMTMTMIIIIIISHHFLSLSLLLLLAIIFIIFGHIYISVHHK